MYVSAFMSAGILYVLMTTMLPFIFIFKSNKILMNQIFMSHAYFHSIFLLNSSIFIQLFENLFYHDLNKMSMKFPFSKNKNLLICIHSIKIMISIV